MIKKLINKIVNLEFTRFVIIGVINTITHNIVYIPLVNIIPYILANTIAFIISTCISFFLNCHFTFRTKPTLKKFIVFPISCFPNFIIQSVGVSVLIEFFYIKKEYAAFLASLMAIPVTFFLMRYILKEKNK
ncbi:GtrA family protein [Clostridium oceanicum]|uniref:GtrA/DPMS transmembrane domain-containing protein n=1 Tax=Clostridium oceanicum TaxID=1543 RepID=A0ABP3V6P0_9CLOT